ncbi:MAG: DedA family protein [Pyrinomonadaceae bacterium]
MEAFLIRYGLAAIALVATVESDLVFILAGVVAHLGLFNLPAAVLAGSAGAFAGDCVWFFVGRSRAGTIRNSRAYRRVGARVEGLADRFGAWQLIPARFVFGTRAVSILFWGMSGLSFWRFAAIDFLGCLLAATSLGTLGYLLSGSAAWLIGAVRQVEIWLLGALLICGGFAIVLRWMVARRHRKII